MANWEHDTYEKSDAPASMLKGLYVMNRYFGTKELSVAYYNWNSWADPLASQIVFASKVAINRAITLEITEKLTTEAATAGELLLADSDLMKAVLNRPLL